MLRAVLDTNVFVSSLLNRAGAPARLLDSWRAGQYFLMISPPIMEEIRAVLELPHIREKYGLADSDIRQLLVLLEKDAMLAPGLSDVGNPIPDDPSDHIFLSCALEAKADVIVSGDRHLLKLGAFRGIPIMTVIEFLDLLPAQETP